MLQPDTTRPNAITLHVAGLPPFIVWSRRPLKEATNDLLADAIKRQITEAHTERIGQKCHAD